MLEESCDVGIDYERRGNDNTRSEFVINVYYKS